MSLVRAIFCFAVLFCAALPAFGQYGDGHIRTKDTLKIDRSGVTGDSTGITGDTLVNDTLDPDSAFFQQVDEDVDLIEPPTFFKKRGGFYGGATVDLASLDPHTLDPVLGGTIVMYGARGYVILNSWMIGAAGAGATLYNLSPKYDRFNYSYAGFLTGYDTHIFQGALALQGSLVVGGGGLTMIKRRPEITDSTGHDILERYREAAYFVVSPGISLGFSPMQYVEISVGANYLIPIGANVSDLRAFTYGIRLTFGLGD